MSKKREPVLIEARLELIEDPNDNPNRGTVPMTPEQRAAAERERADIVARMKADAPVGDGGPKARRLGKRSEMPADVGDYEPPVDVAPADMSVEDDLKQFRTAPVVMSADEIEAEEKIKAAMLSELRQKATTERAPAETEPVLETVPSQALLDANDAVAQADQELADLEAHEKALAAWHAESRAKEAVEHKQKLDALKAKRDAAEAEAKRLKTIQAGAELSARRQAVENAATLERRREKSAQDEKNAALVARMKPTIDLANATLVELRQIQRDHIEDLNALAEMSWRSTPSTWPLDLRKRFEREIVHVAARLHRELSNNVVSYTKLAVEAEKLMKGGWQNDGGFNARVNQMVHDLHYCNADQAPYFRNAIANLNDSLSKIEESGAHLTGEQGEVVVDAGHQALRERQMNRVPELGPDRAFTAREGASSEVGSGHQQTHAVTGSLDDV
jgi:hypothetical protein